MSYFWQKSDMQQRIFDGLCEMLHVGCTAEGTWAIAQSRHLTDWENKFCADMVKRRELGQRISDKQFGLISDIYIRWCSRIDREKAKRA